MSEFWTDLAIDMQDPEFRAAYEQESARIARTDSVTVTTTAAPPAPTAGSTP